MTILDVDASLGIADVSTNIRPELRQPPNLVHYQKLVVELNKENYLVVSLKAEPSALGYITLFDFNWTEG